MRSLVKRLSLPLVCLLLMAACATGRLDAITLSATTAAVVGEQAVETNKQYTLLCGAKKLSVEKCAAWSKFFMEFKEYYALAHTAFKTATAKGDIQSAKDAAQRIQALSNQLILYAIYSGGGS